MTDESNKNQVNDVSNHKPAVVDKTVLMDKTVVLDRSAPVDKTAVIDAASADKTVIFPKIIAADGSATEISTEISIGTTIKDRFVLNKLLGFGGMGAVYRALDKRKQEAQDDDPYVAIKLLGQDFKDHPQAFITLQRETKKTQELAHPNIVTVYDFDRDGDLVYMTMEELKGQSLEDLIKAHEFKRMPQSQALAIVRGIAQGLAYAHSKGIIHSDLKPGNIFVTEDNKVKILDFGIARVMEASQDKSRFDAGELGALSPRYASVEMINQCPPDPRDDIYALGIIACELLSGGHPYKREMATDAVVKKTQPCFTGVGRLMKSALLSAVTNDIEARTPTCEAWLKKLDFAAGGFKKWIVAGIAVLALVVANAVYLYLAQEPHFALEDLPIDEQTRFAELIAEADVAMQFNDINGALFYLEKANLIHGQNPQIGELVDQVLAQIKQSIQDNELDAGQVDEMIENLNQYELFKNEKMREKVAELLE